MKRCRLATVLILAAATHDSEAQSLKDALARGTPSVELRYRFEVVEDAPFEKDAYASTLRTALGYRTSPYKRFSVFLQAQNVVSPGEDRFNNRGAGHLANGVTDRPVVADPSQTRMQQVYLRLDALDTAFDLGRREIFYGNHRFIGNVGWRQNHQAFDAVYLSNHSFEKATLSYTFAGSVIRVFGDEQEMSSHFLNALLKPSQDVSVELYSYLIDYDELEDAALSSQTYGGRLFGSSPVGERLRFLFELAYAKQTDFGDNPRDTDADYLHLLGGVRIFGVDLKVGRELLGGSTAEGAFQTPLATGHAFNGWADKFLQTPPGGLIDRYASAEGKLRDVAWILTFHDFNADEGGASYGSELDFQAVYPTPWKQSLGVKLALYRESGFSTDTRKVWLWTEYTF